MVHMTLVWYVLVHWMWTGISGLCVFVASVDLPNFDSKAQEIWQR